MKTRRTHPWLIFAALAIAAPILSGCTGASAVLGASWPGLAVKNDTIYVSYARVYAFNLDGTAKWSFPDSTHQLAQNQAFFAPPASDDKLIVVTDYTDSIFGLDPASGEQKWVFKSPEKSRFVGGPVMNLSLAYAATVDGVVYAVPRDYKDGSKPKWRYPENGKTGSIWSTPLLADDTLYITSMDAHVYALDPATGALKWKYPDQDSLPENPPLGGIVGTPTLHDGVLYFGSFNNHLYALDVETHKILWSYETSNWVWGSPVVDDKTGYVVAADLDGNIFAIDPTSSNPKKPVWTPVTVTPAAAAGVPAAVVGSPVLRMLDDDTPVVYVGSDGNPNLYVIRVEDGKPALPSSPKSITYTTPGMFLFFPTGSDNAPVPIKLYASPAFAGDTMLLATHEGTNQLYAFDSKTLEYQWKPQALKDVDTALTARNNPQAAQGDQGLLGNPQTLLLMLGMFLLVTLVLRPGQSGKK